jgi:hypothetical protein
MTFVEIFSRRPAGVFVTHFLNDRVLEHFARLKKQSGYLIDWQLFHNRWRIDDFIGDRARSFLQFYGARVLTKVCVTAAFTAATWMCFVSRSLWRPDVVTSGCSNTMSTIAATGERSFVSFGRITSIFLGPLLILPTLILTGCIGVKL